MGLPSLERLGYFLTVPWRGRKARYGRPAGRRIIAQSFSSGMPRQIPPPLRAPPWQGRKGGSDHPSHEWLGYFLAVLWRGRKTGCGRPAGRKIIAQRFSAGLLVGRSPRPYGRTPWQGGKGGSDLPSHKWLGYPESVYNYHLRPTLLIGTFQQRLIINILHQAPVNPENF
jgi:hypothetical protein